MAWEDHFEFPLVGLVQYIQGALGPSGRPLTHYHKQLNMGRSSVKLPGLYILCDHVECIRLGGISECEPVQIVI